MGSVMEKASEEERWGVTWKFGQNADVLSIFSSAAWALLRGGPSEAKRPHTTLCDQRVAADVISPDFLTGAAALLGWPSINSCSVPGAPNSAE